VARSNRLFGGRRAVIAAVNDAIGSERTSLSLLDVGTGLADIPADVARMLAGRGVRITTLGVDEAADLLREARRNVTHAVCGSVRALPFRDGSIDIVICSQLLHHFADTELGGVIAELDRVARSRVIVADLRRSWFAATGFWLASFPLRFHAVTRHDGPLSVLRGFTAAELRRAVVDAVGTVPAVEHRLGFRLTASWSPRRAA
jgi:ubiquinone/menaquinone biosynthesis C-methylase UbiE